ncbi:heavy metal-binding protein HIP-like [Mya arenaria]|uniref:heavy metal-binding protein HIP-like n=1 Tax=Mya arenaria TaxID=6604 RepID=UPI0022E2311F|nr:heavy metal-binding protein HIP-like [Mya arenaria]
MKVQHKYLVLFYALSFVFGDEPHFKTRFDYDEQLLEKMIRMEFQYEQWEKRINESLGKLEKQRTSIQTDLEVLRNEREEFDKHVNETMKHMQQVSKLKDSQQLSKPPHSTILFRARKVADYTLSTANQIIIFSEMLSNVGGGYNSASGKFTAPVVGTYLFTVSLCPIRGKSIFYKIVVKDDVVANGHTYDVAGFLCVSGNAIVQLDANDVVYVKSTYSADVLVQSGLHDSFDSKSNSFSGVLLHSI